MSNEFTLTLNSPITEEQWDMITDVDFDNTNEITFHTKHGKEVKFVKASVQPEQPTGVQDILQYLDEYLHPIVSPENWWVYAELHDMVSKLPSAQPERCDYCTEDSDGFVKPIEKNSHAFIRFGMDGWELSIHAKGWHGSAKIRYCPMCGRRLEHG